MSSWCFFVAGAPSSGAVSSIFRIAYRNFDFQIDDRMRMGDVKSRGNLAQVLVPTRNEATQL